MKRYLSSVICICVIACLVLTGCGQIKKYNNPGSGDSVQTEVTIQSQLLTGVKPADKVTTDASADNKLAFNSIIEAETGVATGNVKLDQTVKGYSGTGYMSWPDDYGNNSLKLEVEIPASQHYNITMVVSSKTPVKNEIQIDSQRAGDFLTTGKESFETITLGNVYITQGKKYIDIVQEDGGINLDSVYIQNSSETDSYVYSGTGVNVNTVSNPKTVNTLKYISDSFGKTILSGQFVTPGTNNELDAIYSATGCYPAIRFSDMSVYTDKKTTLNNYDVQLAADWSNKGGMVGYIWHWKAPMGYADYYSDKTDFDLSKAVTTEDIACMPLDQIETMYKDGKISEECYKLVNDIDIVSAKLHYLKDKGVTVLWRPLDEASGGWFWWGAKGADAYKWLWNLMYTRQTQYFGLDNLIWIWNAQNSAWYVGDDKCDIVSADIYDENNTVVNFTNTFVQMGKVTATKPIALTECIKPQFVDEMLRDKAVWSWFSLWNGEYVMNSNRQFSENYLSKEDINKIYSNDKVITLESLPSFG